MGTTLFHVNEITRKGRKSKWGIDYYSPWDLRPDGTRRRIKKFFETKDARAIEVDALYERYARFGESASVVPTPDELADYRAMKAHLPAGISAAQAAKFFVANRPSGGMALKEVFENYLEAMRVRRLDESWIKQVKGTLGRFLAFLPNGVRAGDVTKEHGRAWMRSMEPKGRDPGFSDESRNNYRRRVHGALEWAVEEEIIESNPFARVEAPQIRRGAPAFYTVDEIRTILAVTALWYPDYVRFLVLRLFVGMRRAQVRRLEDSDINVTKRKIDVPGFRKVAGEASLKRVTKAGERHLIQHAPDVLWDWLEEFPELNTANHLQKFRRILQRSGVTPKKNGFRHTFATYHVNLHGNANLTMHILGQEDDSKAFFDHYRGHADKEDADLYFALFVSSVLPSPRAAVDMTMPPPNVTKPAEILGP